MKIGNLGDVTGSAYLETGVRMHYYDAGEGSAALGASGGRVDAPPVSRRTSCSGSCSRHVVPHRMSGRC
jgi:hypothetical protein